MANISAISQPGIRAVLHISPATYVAGVLSAQRRDQKLSEFLNEAITSACASDEQDPARSLPWSPHTIDLFLQVADTTPESFRGHWKTLYAKVLGEPDLWTTPQAFAGDNAAPGWFINEAALRKAWPRLVSSVFMC